LGIVGLQVKLLSDALAKAKPGDIVQARICDGRVALSFGADVIYSSLLPPLAGKRGEVMEACATGTSRDLVFPQIDFANTSHAQASELAVERVCNILSFKPIVRKKWLGASSMSIAMAG
jgi:hypothetical protein